MLKRRSRRGLRQSNCIGSLMTGWGNRRKNLSKCRSSQLCPRERNHRKKNNNIRKLRESLSQLGNRNSNTMRLVTMSRTFTSRRSRICLRLQWLIGIIRRCRICFWGEILTRNLLGRKRLLRIIRSSSRNLMGRRLLWPRESRQSRVWCIIRTYIRLTRRKKRKNKMN